MLPCRVKATSKLAQHFFLKHILYGLADPSACSTLCPLSPASTMMFSYVDNSSCSPRRISLVGRLLSEFQSSAPGKCQQACFLLLRLSEILLNAYTAVLARVNSTDLSGQYAAARETLLGTLLEHAVQWSNQGTIF